MRIDDTSPLPRTTRRSKASLKPSGGFMLAPEALGGSQSKPASTPMSLGSLESILVLQGDIERKSGSARVQRRQVFEFGERILDSLSDLQKALAMDEGQIDIAVSRLRDTLETEFGIPGDAELQRVLTDIELRARVEIAKLAKNSSRGLL